VKICLLGRFEISVDGKPVQFSGKVQKKPLLLLKALVALGGGEVKAEKLEDLLWPESDGDVAHQSFETTLHRLRKWFGHPNALDFSSGLAALNRGVCWTDVWAFENLLEEAGNQERQGKLDRAVDFTEKAVSLYKGMFLLGRQGILDRVPERLRRKFLGLSIGWATLGRGWEWRRPYCYDRGLQVDDISEEFYERMMICYRRLGRIAEGIDTYERCKRVLSAVLGVKPSPKTEAARKSLL
jgi:DNA-binding SARP family transcriptional activator